MLLVAIFSSILPGSSQCHIFAIANIFLTILHSSSSTVQTYVGLGYVYGSICLICFSFATGHVCMCVFCKKTY